MGELLANIYYHEEVETIIEELTFLLSEDPSFKKYYSERIQYFNPCFQNFFQENFSRVTKNFTRAVIGETFESEAFSNAISNNETITEQVQRQRAYISANMNNLLPLLDGQIGTYYK